MLFLIDKHNKELFTLENSFAILQLLHFWSLYMSDTTFYTGTDDYIICVSIFDEGLNVCSVSVNQ